MQNEKNYNKNCMLISFGNFDMTFTLKLEQNDIDEYNIDIKLLEDLKDLSFLENNKKLWSKIDINSNNKSLNAFIQMNKIKKSNILITYILFGKMNYNDINFDFYPLLEFTLLSNGIIIKPYEISELEINIRFELKYNGKEIITLSSNKVNKENEKEVNRIIDINKNINIEKNNYNEEKSNNMDDIGVYNIVFKEILNFDSFKYLYIDFIDIISINFNEFSIDNLYNFLLKLKNETYIEIIIFFHDKFIKDTELFKFVQISDIHIISNKNYLFELLKLKKIKDKNIYKISKKILYQNLKKNNMNSINNLHENNKNHFYQKENDISYPLIFQKQDFSNKTPNASILNPINSFFNNSSLNKNNLFDYLRYIIYSNRSNDFNNKLGIYFDRFDKIIFVNYKKNNNQVSLNEYNLNIFPKINIYKIKEIEQIKNILIKNESKYLSLGISSIISEIITNKEKLNINNFYSISLTCSYLIKRFLIYEINNFDIPINKSFYTIKINKNIIKDYINIKETEKKENGFNTHFSQEKNKLYKNLNYKPLRDKYLRSYMQSQVNINILKQNDFINTKKKILTKRIISPIQRNINSENNIKSFIDFINKKNVNDKEQDYMKEFMKRKIESKYYIPGANGIKGYFCYLGNIFRKNNSLPKLKNKYKSILKKNKIKNIIEIKNINNYENKNIRNNSMNINIKNNSANKNIRDNSEENKKCISFEDYNEINKENELRDISLFKEIIFKKTPQK